MYAGLSCILIGYLLIVRIENFLMDDVSVYIAMLEFKLGYPLLVGLSCAIEVTAFDPQEAVFWPDIIRRPPFGMRIRARTAAKFPQVGIFRMRYVLPVPVASANNQIIVLVQCFADLISFGFKNLVGVVVFFVFPVRTNDWSLYY